MLLSMYIKSILIVYVYSGDVSSPVFALSSPPPRRLIIAGASVDGASELLPFSVALMYCRDGFKEAADAGPGSSSSSAVGLYCAAFCSGSLVAPNVVLTAGHCLFDKSTGRGSVPLSHLYVLIGSTNFFEPSGGQLIKVSRAFNAGFGKSSRFPLDDDLAIVSLSSCADGLDSVVQIATMESELKFAPICSVLTTVGFGRHATVPVELFVHDGGLRVEQTRLHSHATCAAASNFSSLLAPEKFICSGGDQSTAICNGDSGGPVLVQADSATGGFHQVGISSFGKSAFCGNSPDYSTRVSTYAEWISRVLVDEHIAVCPGWSWDKSFASWPVLGSDFYGRSEPGGGLGEDEPSGQSPSPGRCPVSEWKCASSEQCVPLSVLCDSNADCSDGSDETANACKDWSLEQAEFESELEQEFSILVQKNSNRTITNSSPTMQWESVGWLEIPAESAHEKYDADEESDAEQEKEGGLESGLASPSSFLRSDSSDPDVKGGYSPGFCRNPALVQNELLLLVHNRCMDEVAEVEAFIARKRADASNTIDGAEKACSSLAKCVGLDQPLPEWLKRINTCGVMNVVSNSERDVIKLCGGLDEYLTHMANREQYRADFGSKYGSTCSLESGLGNPTWRPGGKNPDKTSAANQSGAISTTKGSSDVRHGHRLSHQILLVIYIFIGVVHHHVVV